MSEYVGFDTDCNRTWNWSAAMSDRATKSAGTDSALQPVSKTIAMNVGASDILQQRERRGFIGLKPSRARHQCCR